MPILIFTLLGAAAARGAASDVTTPPGNDRVIRFTELERPVFPLMRCGELPSREILEVNGGGMALIDFDRDGDLDIFLANGATLASPGAGPGSRLARNDGAMQFTDVTPLASITLNRWAGGVTVGDFDGDGWDDLYVGCFGAEALLRNLGDGTFAEIPGAGGASSDAWTTSVATGDFDGDGDLDLYAVNYVEFDPAAPPTRAKYKGVEVMAGPHGLIASHDCVYENLGGMRFREVTQAWGFLPPRPAYGLNAAVVDVDMDGHVDILVGNDSMPNFLFRRAEATPDGPRFEEIGVRSGAACDGDGNAQATMGVAVADVDGNGRVDFFSTNFSSDTNTLHLGNVTAADALIFDDGTRAWGLGAVSRPFLGWATAFFDWDHDGDEDLLVFNGHVYPEATTELMDSTYEQTPLLFERQERRFVRVRGETAGAWLDVPRRHRGAAFGDLDGDGDIDVVVGELNGPVQLLRSEAASPDRRDWIILALRDDLPGSSNHDAIGATIEIRQGERMQRRWIHSGCGFQSSSDRAVHVAIDAEAGPLQLRIRWPGGEERLAEIARDQFGRRLELKRSTCPLLSAP